MGTEASMNEAAEKYHFKLSVLTEDDEVVRKRLKIMREATQVQPTQNKSAVSQRVFSYENEIESHNQEDDYSHTQASTSMTAGYYPKTTNSSVQESLHNISQMRQLMNEQFERQNLAIKQHFELLTASNKVSQFQKWPATKFEEDGTSRAIDLIEDVDGKKPHLWLKNCVMVVFTKEEIQAGTFVFSNRSNRPAMDPVRVRMLKACLRDKYKLKEKNNDDIWAYTVEAINSKGRGFAYGMKKALGLRNDNI
jgi:hypothetical protein